MDRKKYEVKKRSTPFIAKKNQLSSSHSVAEWLCKWIKRNLIWIWRWKNKGTVPCNAPYPVSLYWNSEQLSPCYWHPTPLNSRFRIFCRGFEEIKNITCEGWEKQWKNDRKCETKKKRTRNKLTSGDHSLTIFCFVMYYFYNLCFIKKCRNSLKQIYFFFFPLFYTFNNIWLPPGHEKQNDTSWRCQHHLCARHRTT